MRTRRGDVEEEEVEEDDDEDEDVDNRDASRSRASWFLYQRILSAEMRMKSFLGWSAALWRLEGLGEVTRAIVGGGGGVGLVGVLECKCWLRVERDACVASWRGCGSLLGWLLYLW